MLSEGGAAAGLEAETSDNITYGIILQPPLGDAGDLSIAVDYFDIKIDNGVDQAGGNNILTRCYDDPDFRAGGGLCRLVTRNPRHRAADRLQRPHQYRDPVKRKASTTPFASNTISAPASFVSTPRRRAT